MCMCVYIYVYRHTREKYICGIVPYGEKCVNRSYRSSFTLLSVDPENFARGKERHDKNATKLALFSRTASRYFCDSFFHILLLMTIIKATRERVVSSRVRNSVSTCSPTERDTIVHARLFLATRRGKSKKKREHNNVVARLVEFLSRRTNVYYSIGRACTASLTSTTHIHRHTRF